MQDGLQMMALARVGGFVVCSCCRSKDRFLNYVTRQNSATMSEYGMPGQLISFAFFRITIDSSEAQAGATEVVALLCYTLIREEAKS